MRTFFLNYCWHWFLKINWYNYVFPMHLQVLELDLWFFGSFKSKFHIFESMWNFLQFFFSISPTFNIDVMNIIIHIILSMELIFIIKSIPSKINIIFGIVLQYFQVQMIWYKCFWKAQRKLNVPMKYSKNSIWIEMLKEG